MAKGLWIIGTDTEVGKTVVAAGLMDLLLRKQYRAAYFKPIASGMSNIGGVPRSLDACFVKTVSGFDEEEKRITPFAFKNAVAPHLAARIENRPIDVAVIKEALNYLKERYDIIIGEGAGGLAIPLNNQGYMQYDLIRDLGFSCLLVSRPGLGTINHTLLTLRYAQSLGIRVKAVFLNGFNNSEMEQDNRATLKQLEVTTPFFTIPACAGVDSERMQPGDLQEIFAEALRIEDVIGLMEAL